MRTCRIIKYCLVVLLIGLLLCEMLPIIQQLSGMNEIAYLTGSADRQEKEWFCTTIAEIK